MTSAAKPEWWQGTLPLRVRRSADAVPTHGAQPGKKPGTPPVSVLGVTTGETVRSKDAEFDRWCELNPHILDWLERRALELKRTRERYSIKKLFEEARWDTGLREQHGDLKLNNNMHSRVARLLMNRNRELVGFFEVRKLAT